MSRLSGFLSGGFLAGRRTYVLVLLAVAAELGRWAVGDQSLWMLLDRLPSIFGDLSIAALRAGVAASAFPGSRAVPARGGETAPLPGEG